MKLYSIYGILLVIFVVDNLCRVNGATVELTKKSDTEIEREKRDNGSTQPELKNFGMQNLLAAPISALSSPAGYNIRYPAVGNPSLLLNGYPGNGLTGLNGFPGIGLPIAPVSNYPIAYPNGNMPIGSNNANGIGYPINGVGNIYPPTSNGLYPGQQIPGTFGSLQNLVSLANLQGLNNAQAQFPQQSYPSVTSGYYPFVGNGGGLGGGVGTGPFPNFQG